VRKAIHLRDWEKAQEKIRDWEIENRITEEAEPVEPKTVKGAWESFIADCQARNLREPTIKKYSYFQKQMDAFAESRGIRYVQEFDTGLLTEFRVSWKSQNVSALKRLQLLRSYFRFCQDQGWVSDNPARRIRNPKVEDRPTLPLDQKEIMRTLTACDKFEGSPLTRLRLRALILLMRFAGLRIGDAVTLARDRIANGKLFLYTSKAGTPVCCPLPEIVLRALDALPLDRKYFFWSGQSKIKTIASHWEAEIKKLFELAKVEHGHSHRLRDSFAVQLLLQGVPLERVAILLGHRSIKVTERHYSPWIRARQEQVEADIRKSWDTEVQMYDTLLAHGETDLVQ
jgi:site-specific recombinase XerD